MYWLQMAKKYHTRGLWNLISPLMYLIQGKRNWGTILVARSGFPIPLIGYHAISSLTTMGEIGTNLSEAVKNVSSRSSEIYKLLRQEPEPSENAIQLSNRVSVVRLNVGSILNIISLKLNAYLNPVR